MVRANIAKGKKNDGVDEFGREVILTILQLMRSLRSSGMEKLTEVELSYPQSMMLYALLEKGSMTVGELAQHLRVTQGVVSRMVDRLVEKGMLFRERDSHDRRVVLVTLSESGCDYAEKMITYHLNSLRPGLQSVSEVERVAFLAVLRHISESMPPVDDE